MGGAEDFVDNGEIDVVWCPGDDCITDVYTKAVDTAKFKRFSSLLLGDGPTTIEKAPVVNAVHSYHIDHVLNGKSVCLGGVCVGCVSRTSRFAPTVSASAQRAQTQARQPAEVNGGTDFREDVGAAALLSKFPHLLLDI